MRVQIVTTPAAVSVCASKADAAKARVAFNQSGTYRRDIQTFEVNVPTQKDELIKFLNMLTSQETSSKGVELVAAHYALTRKD